MPSTHMQLLRAVNAHLALDRFLPTEHVNKYLGGNFSLKRTTSGVLPLLLSRDPLRLWKPPDGEGQSLVPPINCTARASSRVRS